MSGNNPHFFSGNNIVMSRSHRRSPDPTRSPSRRHLNESQRTVICGADCTDIVASPIASKLLPTVTYVLPKKGNGQFL